MIRGLYAPSDFITIDQDPLLSVPEKLAAIQASPVFVHPSVVNGHVYQDEFTIKLPYTVGGSFSDGLQGFPETLLTDYVNVGDAALYGHGIGTRLLKAAFRHSVEHNPKITEFHTGWARLGLINATVSILGEENVGVDHHRKRYGWGGKSPLDAMFDDFPHIEGAHYLVDGIVAHIDRGLAMTWEAPVYVEPKVGS